MEREQFFQQLGSTFMPGTPLMQAPLGLAGYVPAVLDPDSGLEVPDEIALIVYASREVYDAKRSTSLSRRMYTASHAAIFDMARALAGFPGALESPTKVETGPEPDESWYLVDRPVDWQDGTTRVVVLASPAPDPSLPARVREAVAVVGGRLHDHAVDQVIGVATASYAALWVHAAAPTPPTLDQLGLLPARVPMLRDLVCRPAYVRSDEDSGVTIAGAAAYTFRFARALSYFEAAR